VNAAPFGDEDNLGTTSKPGSSRFAGASNLANWKQELKAKKEKSRNRENTFTTLHDINW
jgi:hypothetical protein